VVALFWVAGVEVALFCARTNYYSPQAPMEAERRSASGLFVLPQSLPDEHPLVVQPEPEPEPDPTLEEATGTLLDHLSVRCGREVRMSV
jgi:hypothetical protein